MPEVLDSVVKKFNTTPFLFIGSGMSRRYLNFPNWEGLLRQFCEKIADDEYEFIRLKRESGGDFAKLGSLLEKEFNERWYKDKSIRSDDKFVSDSVRHGCSPFKSEISLHLRSFNKINERYAEEVSALKRISERNVSGIITTNYDKFIETLAPKYSVYASQEDLIFSSVQGFAEIYKIHGSVDNPESIVITAQDYERFDRKAKYLAAKLLTIFVEYPVVFLGYSMSDANIRKILIEIIECIPGNKIGELANKFIFVQHGNNSSVEVQSHSMDFSGISIPMTLITTDNYLEVYKSLQIKKAGYPVHMLRMFKEGLYNYAITGVPSKHCIVEPYDQAVPDDSIIFSLGVKNERQGLVGITATDWYRDVLFDNLNKFSADDVLDYSYKNLNRRKTHLPVFKLLSKASRPHPEISVPESFDDLITTSVKKSRGGKNFDSRTVKGILCQYPDTNRRVNYLPYLMEGEFNVDDLEGYLRDLLIKEPNIICEGANQSHVKRLIRIYDWLKHRKK